MTVQHARVLALAAVLVGIGALVLSPHLHAQQPLDELPLDELGALAEQGDPPDRVAAHMLLSLAMSEASPQTREGVAEQLRAVVEEMTPDEIAEAQRRAREWMPTQPP